MAKWDLIPSYISWQMHESSLSFRIERLLFPQHVFFPAMKYNFATSKTNFVFSHNILVGSGRGIRSKNAYTIQQSWSKINWNHTVLKIRIGRLASSHTTPYLKRGGTTIPKMSRNLITIEVQSIRLSRIEIQAENLKRGRDFRFENA